MVKSFALLCITHKDLNRDTTITKLAFFGGGTLREAIVLVANEQSNMPEQYKHPCFIEKICM
jgi:hypothetical protein